MKGIKEYSRDELLKLAIPYFQKNNDIIATSDGNFFYTDEQNKHYADAHANSNNLQKYYLSKGELNKPKEIPEDLTEDQKTALELLDTSIYKKGKAPYLKIKKQIIDNSNISEIIENLKDKQSNN